MPLDKILVMLTERSGRGSVVEHDCGRPKGSGLMMVATVRALDTSACFYNDRQD